MGSNNTAKKEVIPATVWTTNAVQVDGYDPILWGSVREASSKIQGMTQCDDEDLATSDVFYSLYKSNPVLQENMNEVQKAVMETLTSLPEYRALRSFTKFDDIASALGVMKFAPSVLEQYRALQEKLDAQTNNQKDGEPQPTLSDDDISGMRRAFREALGKAQNDVEEWGEVKSGWGISSGDLQKMSLGNKLELANTLRNSNKFKNIADLAGRFRNVALAAETTTPSHGNDEIVDVGQGDALARLLPSELAKFKTNKLLFMKDFVEKQLLVYNLRGTENLGAGPIVVCLDVSGSMAGEREVWAKAVILGLIALAEKQKRPFGVLTFDSRVRWSKLYSGTPSLQDKIELAELPSNGGGTSFYEPLKAAFEMRKEASILKPADVVFITDGECELTDEQILEIAQLKAETSVRIFGVGISDAGQNEVSMGSLEAFSDNVAIVNSLGDIAHVKGIMVKTASKTKVA